MLEKFQTKSLRKELVLVLILKLCLLWGLWYIFFSNPVDKYLTPEQFANTVFSINEPINNKPDATPAEDDHD